MKKYLYILSMLIGMLSFSNAFAGQAQLLLYPTRIVLDSGARSATVGLKNNGDATGSYRIELVDMLMPEDGGIREMTDKEADPYSAKSIVRISPRSTTLEAGQDQNIRLLVRPSKDMTDGEYRSHLKVTLTDDNAEPVAAKEGEKAPEKGVGIVIKPRFSVIIPVIIRYGKTDYSVSITEAKITYKEENGKKIPSIDMTLERKGNRSSMGDIDVTYSDEKGKKTVLKHVAGIPVYRSTEKRKVELPLDMPEGMILGKGKIHVTYKAQSQENSVLLAEKEFAL